MAYLYGWIQKSDAEEAQFLQNLSDDFFRRTLPAKQEDRVRFGGETMLECM